MDIKQVSAALEKAASFLEKNQQPDGSWSIVGPFGHKEPPYYQKPIVLTPEAILTLILSKNRRYLPLVSKAINFCLKEEVTDQDHIDLWAWKAIALALSNTETCKKEHPKIIQFLEKHQAQEGYWPCFPSTYNLTNYSVILALHRIGRESALKKAKSWLLKNKAADGIGWGFNHESKESEVSFTGNVTFALLLAGQDPLSGDLQKVKDFLLSKQLADGGWPSSKATIADKSTVYSTAFVVTCLSILSENTSAKQIEKGLKFLLDAQNPDGGWPLTKKEKSEFYTTYYASYALALYKYLKENLDSPKFSYLKEKLPVQQLAQFLLLKFEEELTNWVRTATNEALADSNLIGSTFDAVMRRKDILRTLSKTIELTPAEIIDELKKDKKYEHLNKRSHITLIKNDLDYLRSLKLVFEQNNRYFIVADLLA